MLPINLDAKLGNICFISKVVCNYFVTFALKILKNKKNGKNYIDW